MADGAIAHERLKRFAIHWRRIAHHAAELYTCLEPGKVGGIVEEICVYLDGILRLVAREGGLPNWSRT
jgi:hypothetical protein